MSRYSSLYLCVFLVILCDFGHTTNNPIFEINSSDYFPIVLSTELAQTVTKLKQISQVAGQEKTFKSLFEAADGCKLCEEVVDGIIALRRSNATKTTMVDYLNVLCSVYTSWGETGCTGRINNEVDTYLYIIDHKEDLKPATFCALKFQEYNCEDPDAVDWTISIPPLPSTTVSAVSSDESTILKILQITDVHIDPLYTPGSNSECKTPLCCQTGTPENEDDAAGYWGEYKSCDMPWHTMDNMLDNIKNVSEDIDYIYFTGDIVSHNNWITSVKSNTEIISDFFDLLSKSFPNKTVFPIFGNHEPHPTDYYSPESVDKTSNVSTQWLFDLASEKWSQWLPNDTQTTVKKGGYYTVLVKPGFRIIALNSNVCYVANLWLTFENNDTYDQLQWLVDILTEAEKSGEKVHILSHIPSGDSDSSCTKVWSREFKKIVLRFADTIVAQFNGHTHYDEFKLYFDDENKTEVKAVAYNGASFTTIWGRNSNYKLYDVDSTTLAVTDYNEFTFNLTEANLDSKVSPNWFKLYSFKEAYGLTDLSLKSLGDLYQKMASNNSDNDLVDQYYRYRYRESDEHKNVVCDSECKKQLVCVISAGDTSEILEC